MTKEKSMERSLIYSHFIFFFNYRAVPYTEAAGVLDCKT